MKKNILTLIIVLSFVGGIIVSDSVISNTSAGIWQDIVDKVSPFFGGNNVKDKPADIENVSEPYISPSSYEDAVIKAVEDGSKSVVSIIISKDLPIIEQCPNNPFGNNPDLFDFFGRDFGFQFYQPCEKGTKYQEVGGGSGFIISKDGLIVTNKHVVSDEKADYTVLINNGNKYKAEVLARDPVLDLAIIKINAPEGLLYPAKLGDSDSIKLGQTTIAIGNALGEFRNTVSIGVVSGLARSITASNGASLEKIDDLIQTDAAINKGNSGGPLLNLKGEVIGINTAIVAGAQNIGFAIPVNQAKRDIESVKKTGTIKTPYLGVRYFVITPELALEQKLTVEYGALVRGNESGPGVIPDGPADKAGILSEDIILSVNSEKLDGDKTLVSIIQKYDIGDKLNLGIKRGDNDITLDVVLEERP
ncbi:MAG TPA: trypsin-like peptidase domain-containing protein [Candidatus Paceibacterota bacterium]